MTLAIDKGIEIPLPCRCLSNMGVFCPDLHLLWNILIRVKLHTRSAETWQAWKIARVAQQVYEEHFSNSSRHK